MTAAPDRRVRRTRRLLREALVALILERGWDAVSVQEVCEHADVGRSTFYVHFADKEELLLSGFDDLHAALDLARAGQDGSFAFVPDLIEHAHGNQRLFRAVVGKRSGAAVQRRFRDVVTRLVGAELERVRMDKQRRPLVARYISGGLVELLVSWLERPAGVDAQALAASFQTFTRGVLGSLS